MPFLGKLVVFEGDRKGDPGYFAPQNSGMTGEWKLRDDRRMGITGAGR